MASGESDAVTCACPDCVCMVKAGAGVTREGKAFCCEARADGHGDHAGCGHSGCECHG